MPRSVRMYAWSLGFAGISLLLLYLPNLPMEGLLSVLGLAICAIIFERFTLVLPNRVGFSLASIFVFIAYADFSVAAAFTVQAAEAITSAWNVKSVVKKAFNFGQLLLSVFMFHLSAAAIATAFPLFGWRLELALLLSGLVYFATNIGLVSAVIQLASQRPLRTILPDLLSDGYVGVLGALGLFIPLRYLFSMGGWLSLILFCLCLLSFRYAVNLYLRQKQSHLDSISQLSALIERKTGAAESHAARVAQIARSVAELRKLPPEEVDTIYAAAILHDIGETQVEPRVVSVMARGAIPTLADEEAYRQHPLLGEQLVSRMTGMGPIAKLIRHHHEAWDGSGYPEGLKGPEIPMGARILAAAEALEAESFTLEAKLEAIPRLTGTVIDPALAISLEQSVHKMERGAITTESIVQDANMTMLQSELLQAARNSRLLEQMGVGRILSFERGRFTNFIGSAVVPPAAEQMAGLAAQCIRSQLPVRNHLVHQGIAYDVYCIPAGDEVASLLFFDISHALEVEREQLRRIFRAYREIMAAGTRGKLLLIDDEERSRLLTAGETRCEISLRAISDGPAARIAVGNVARSCGFTQSELFQLTVCASEAATNVFKHAGTGSLSIQVTDHYLRILVSDQGDGIPYDILPQAVLMEGYSTKRSLGKGFTVMLRFLDRIQLHTSAAGTLIVLEKQLPAQTVPTALPTGASG